MPNPRTILVPVTLAHLEAALNTAESLVVRPGQPPAPRATWCLLAQALKDVLPDFPAWVSYSGVYEVLPDWRKEYPRRYRFATPETTVPFIASFDEGRYDTLRQQLLAGGVTITLQEVPNGD